MKEELRKYVDGETDYTPMMNIHGWKIRKTILIN